MGKFNKNGSKEVPELNTSSLPDLIFSILFFFMMVTSMREVTLKVEFQTPKGTEIEKLEKKSLVSYVYIGRPTKEFRSKMGTGTRIQLNDRFASVKDVAPFVANERADMRQADQAIMKVALKADQDVQMGVMTDVKMELRRARALSLMYSAEDRNKQ